MDKSPNSIRPTAVFETFWTFAAERQQIYMRRLRGEQPPWTTDGILQSNRFTNVFRAADRTTQYLIRNVIYDSTREPRDTILRVLFFKLFNSISTWEHVTARVELSVNHFNTRSIKRELARVAEVGPVYSAAYVIPPVVARSEAPKYSQHVDLIDRMLKDRLPERLASAKDVGSLFDALRTYPSIGPFLAYQFATDLNYAPIFCFDEMQFVVAGPGSRDGIARCFGAHVEAPETIIRRLADSQEGEFRKRGLQAPTLWGRRLQLIDVQNLFCEVSKYARVAHPSVAGISGRTRIKRRYVAAAGKLPTPWFPPPWGLNPKIGPA